MKKLKDLTGETFNLLTVVRFDKYAGQIPSRKLYWICRCMCGNEKSVESYMLRHGVIKSCGCLAKNNLCRTTHGMTHSSSYISWTAMKQRCYDPNAVSYPRYGGRGITVCERWRDSFENFISDMGERPLDRQLERIDNSEGYSPENCRWATAKEQARNRRSSKHVIVGDDRITIAEAAERAGVPYKTHWKRLKRKGSISHTR